MSPRMIRNMKSALKLWEGFTYEGYVRSCEAFAEEREAGGDGDLYVADGQGGWGLAEPETALFDGPSCSWAHGLPVQKVRELAPWMLSADLKERHEGLMFLEAVVHSLRVDVERAAAKAPSVIAATA